MKGAGIIGVKITKKIVPQVSRGEILYIGLISINQWGKIVPKSNDSVEVEVTMSRGPGIVVD